MKTYTITILFSLLMSVSVLAQYDDATSNLKPGSLTQTNKGVDEYLISDDLVVQGSIGLGLDMPSGYGFGFSTIAMRENNLRIFFDDTSTPGGGFPDNDWQLTANGSNGGDDNYFGIDDITNNTSPFRVQSGVRNNALFVRRGAGLTSNGFVGFGTNNPVRTLHMVYGDTPGIRLDQDGSMGYPSQVWDVYGNEANFMISDITNGSAYCFRIQPGTPTNTLTLRSGGKVGIGTWSPEHTLEVAGDAQVNSYFYFGDESTDGNWRVSVVAGKLTFEKREGGVWNTKMEME
ncbi:MAG: hypothetical protein KQI35_14570 [Bacteroidetes bacterium]|nr:hypothetical protein [Bacteroidota bacterium]